MTAYHTKNHMNCLSQQMESILNIITKMETSISALIQDYSDLILLRQHQEAAKQAKENAQQPTKTNKKKKKSSTIPKLPQLCSLDSAAPLQTKEDNFLAHQESYLLYIQHTKKTVTAHLQILQIRTYPRQNKNYCLCQENQEHIHQHSPISYQAH